GGDPGRDVGEHLRPGVVELSERPRIERNLLAGDDPVVLLAREAAGAELDHERYLSVVPISSAPPRSTARHATAASVVARPRCQNTMRSSSRSRPGRRPATIWPSSACRVSAVSRPART